MRRLLLTAVLAFVPLAAEAQFTFIAAVGGNDSASGTTLDASSSLNVASGDLLVAYVYWEGGTGSPEMAKDSGSPANDFTFDGGDQANASGQSYGALGYRIAASADATMTPRFTLGTARSWRRMLVAQFRPDAGETVTKDGSAIVGESSATPSSGNISTTGTDEVVVGASNNYQPWEVTNEEIDGIAATEPTGSPQATAALWYRILTAPFTDGAATCAIDSATSVVTGVIAFKSVGAGGASMLPLMGVGD